MTVELTTFSVIATIFIIHTVLVHLLNWMFRKSNMFKTDALAIAIALNCLEFAFTFLIIKNILL